MGPISSDGKGGGRDSHRFPMTDHRETGAVEPRRNLSGAGGRGSFGGSGCVVGAHVHWPQAGGFSPVDDAAPHF